MRICKTLSRRASEYGRRVTRTIAVVALVPSDPLVTGTSDLSANRRNDAIVGCEGNTRSMSSYLELEAQRMQSETPSTALRRSSRVPAEMQILVTSLAGAQFSEVCKTLVVNAHGCALQTPVKFDAGVPLRFHSRDGRETTARVVSCQPIGADSRAWRLGAKLDRPENFWRLNNCPEDWTIQAKPIPVSQIAPGTKLSSPSSPVVTNQTFEAKLDLVAQRLETPLKRLIAESLAPVEAQVAALKDKIARREANPSRFDVSLSSIPAELEQQLESRLRRELEPRVLRESREQYADLLKSAKITIEQRISEGHEAFLRKVDEQLKALEKYAQEVSAKISASAEENLRRGMGDIQRKLSDGATSLKHTSEHLQASLQKHLHDEHIARRHELEQLRASMTAESSRLRQEMDPLERRIAKLVESVHSLEAGLDKRLGQMSSNVMKDTRSQLESAASEILDQLTANSVKAVENHLVETRGKMAAAQQDKVASFSESLNGQTTSALQDFEHSMDEMARLSVDRWQLKLADNLHALAKSLREQFESESD